jgi:hypothetical protein
MTTHVRRLDISKDHALSDLPEPSPNQPSQPDNPGEATEADEWVARMGDTRGARILWGLR